MQQKWIDAYLDVATRFSELSSASHLRVGCIIVREHRIISVGYNGMPAGWDNECESLIDGISTTKDEVLHAEENAIAKLARDGERGLGATLFCTHAPCIKCAKLIYAAGITHVYYRHMYRCSKGVEFLIKCEIGVN